jgi:hypothetical protein
MKFRYIGDYPAGADYLDVYGVRFTQGAVLDVPAQFERKFLGNRFFVREDEDCVPEIQPDTTEDGQTLDKAALLARAEELGVEVDKRWGAKRLTEEIEKASDDKG